jgi:SAM-dependent methyltransferase
MYRDTNLILASIARTGGFTVDLGRNKGQLRQPLQKHGYQYINLDIRRFGELEPTLIGDVHRLPFKEATLDVVISKDTLEHFLNPWAVAKEVHRTLKSRWSFHHLGAVYAPLAWNGFVSILSTGIAASFAGF